MVADSSSGAELNALHYGIKYIEWCTDVVNVINNGINNINHSTEEQQCEVMDLESRYWK